MCDCVIEHDQTVEAPSAGYIYTLREIQGGYRNRSGTWPHSDALVIHVLLVAVCRLVDIWQKEGLSKAVTGCQAPICKTAVPLSRWPLALFIGQ
jgi:hypothetical protein